MQEKLILKLFNQNTNELIYQREIQGQSIIFGTYQLSQQLGNKKSLVVCRIQNGFTDEEKSVFMGLDFQSLNYKIVIEKSINEEEVINIISAQVTSQFLLSQLTQSQSAFEEMIVFTLD